MGNYDAARAIISAQYDLPVSISSFMKKLLLVSWQGTFSYKRGSHLESYALYMHSIKCFTVNGVLLL